MFTIFSRHTLSQSSFFLSFALKPLFVQVQVLDSLNNLFDNFTSASTRLEWHADRRHLLGLESPAHALRSLQLSVDAARTLVLLSNRETAASHRVHYAELATRGVRGEATLTGRLTGADAAASDRLAASLRVHLVDDVKVTGRPRLVTSRAKASSILSGATSGNIKFFISSKISIQKY